MFPIDIQMWKIQRKTFDLDNCGASRQIANRNDNRTKKLTAPRVMVHWSPLVPEKKPYYWIESNGKIWNAVFAVLVGIGVTYECAWSRVGIFI